MDGTARAVETYVGFHVHDGFWVDERLDLRNPEQADRLRGIVPEIAVSSAKERFKAIVCIDGLILLRMQHLAGAVPNMANPAEFDASVLWWREHLDYANTLQVFLESESIKCDRSSDLELAALSLSDTCRVGFRQLCAVNRVADRGRSFMDVRSATVQWIASGMTDALPVDIRDPEWGPWRCVSRDAISRALHRFETAVADPDRVRWLSFVAQAKTAFFQGNFMVSCILLWFVIESALNAWHAEQFPQRAAPPSVAATIKQLMAVGVLTPQFGADLTALRQLRNRLMHEPGSTQCLPSNCVLAAQAATDLAARGTDLDLVLRWEASAQF